MHNSIHDDNRTISAQCLNRYDRYCRPGLNKGLWTVAEDASLVLLMNEGLESWGEIAKRLGTRCQKQCRERWSNHLDPSVDKNDFTAEEDATILELQTRIGNKWSEIARQLLNRTVSGAAPFHVIVCAHCTAIMIGY
jgi:hypothetical protein